jgi:hypothetical protein
LLEGGGGCFIVHRENIQLLGINVCFRLKHCLRSEDAFVITCVANLMEVKVLYVQQDLPYEIFSYLRAMFNIFIPTLTEHERHLHLQ